MDNAAFAAVHGREAERLTGAFYVFSGHLRRHAQFLNAERTVVVGIERNPRMIVGVHAQRFLRDVFERQQKLGAIAQQQVDVFALKLDHNVRAFKLRVALVARFDGELQRETGIVNYLAKELLDPWSGLVNRILWLQAFFFPFLITEIPGVGGAVLLKNHCCATPTRLLER